MAREARTREDMPSRYDPGAAERRWYPIWMERGYFHAQAPTDRQPYCIVLPPPNVTGRLHMGHALNHTMQDILARRARMQGYETLWLPGTDHAGIATQVVVERELRKEGLDRRELGRERFLERVWAWKERYGGEIVEQIKALGQSCDWDRLRFTMDEGLSRAVRVAFVRMYEDGLIYQGERIINWCPVDQTALSDSEVEHAEKEGELVTFRYPLADGSGHVAVATTRVETMLGDTGVAVHPDDPRYRDLVGRTVRHPLDGRELPIVADPVVDPAFGTGAVKVTPAHDPTDFGIAERTGLPARNVLAADATIADPAPEAFRGLDRYEARIRVRERLEELGLVERVERPYVHSVGHCYRCHAEIEPWLSGKQWFVAVDRLKEEARRAVREGRIRFVPERWAANHDEWLAGLRDWNISRQLWWGHRIPVWYCPNGHRFAAIEDPTSCPDCGTGEIEQDPDVLDTWFSSQLWPFSTLGWPDDTEDLRAFYPTSVLVTGYEILYLWVARMIMSGLYLMGDVPFRDVVIHGLVRDAQGRKMSKSLGNVIDPLDMIRRYGADALRFALAWMASPDQQNLPLKEESIEAGRNFANKTWNAARLVLRAFPGGGPELPPSERRTLADRWLLSRHEACRAEVDQALDAYRFDAAAQALHRFLWSEFCDWALEWAKGRLHGDDPAAREDQANLLAWVLERTLRLLHPIMPFVTEEIWQRLGAGASIVVAPWPEPRPGDADPGAEEAFAELQAVVTEIRALQAGLPPELRGRLEVDERLRPLLEPELADLERVAGAGVAFADLAGARVRPARAEGVDLGPALASRRRRLAEVRARLERKRSKLANEAFLSRAPVAVVEKERRDVAELERDEARLLAELAQLGDDAA
ncbi:MAG TPA: valine--tRNA ligase [Actinomycetota bacterium]|nr:valine--tRNA ligase [Actinomycetota bacterium]